MQKSPLPLLPLLLVVDGIDNTRHITTTTTTTTTTDKTSKAHIAELRKCNKEQPQFFKVLYRDHVKEEQSFITIHDLFETFSPCKSIDSSSPDTTEVETEEQRSVSG
ncbi:hypothetical protein T4B_10012 [Trichinella pseudospiralis]|uniref:Uncharacterized protein n=1 Tax=Trichinella pseudospiralis TaxID=6337 RepID=A0A0V1IZ18_TRIPS|nr:hypothetical protein T4B_10012 [Trichinella pseudospiralis]KRZ39750.1 hypothetical protein T4C_4645 [Trichinella pseudospiralis]